MPSPASSRLHGILVQQMCQLLANMPELDLYGWGPGNYSDSPSARSLSDIIQGSLLAKRQYIAEGFCLIRRGFSNIDHIFETRTLDAMLDMMVHLHQYCNPDIIQRLYNHLVTLSKEQPEKGRRVHASLNVLLHLSTNPDISYIDTMLEAQFYIYNEFRC